MNGLVLSGCAPHSLLSHTALYGLAAICEEAGAAGILSWTSGMSARPQLAGVDEDAAAAIVHDHARVRAVDGSWLREDFPLGSEDRALMSPRISRITDDLWKPFQVRRHRVLDASTEQRAYLDLRLIGALGEPAYWRFDSKGAPLQDDGASRLEMQPRNHGSEFVGTRLRKVAEAVAARTVEQVRDGLTGRRVLDEVGEDRADSRAATGLAGPGPVDNVLVWCALWGISQFPLSLQVREVADTAGHTGPASRGTFYVPMWSGQWRPARLRTLIASEQLRAVARPDYDVAEEGAVARRETALRWLAARSVVAVVRFGVRVVGVVGSVKARERRAGRGEVVPITTEP